MQCFTLTDTVYGCHQRLYFWAQACTPCNHQCMSILICASAALGMSEVMCACTLIQSTWWPQVLDLALLMQNWGLAPSLDADHLSCQKERACQSSAATAAASSPDSPSDSNSSSHISHTQTKVKVSSSLPLGSPHLLVWGMQKSSSILYTPSSTLKKSPVGPWVQCAPSSSIDKHSHQPKDMPSLMQSDLRIALRPCFPGHWTPIQDWSLHTL